MCIFVKEHPTKRNLYLSFKCSCFTDSAMAVVHRRYLVSALHYLHLHYCHRRSTTFNIICNITNNNRTIVIVPTPKDHRRQRSVCVYYLLFNCVPIHLNMGKVVIPPHVQMVNQSAIGIPFF